MHRIERKPLEYSGIFYDSANLEDFKKWFESKILGGATTNPVLFEKEGVLDVTERVRSMVDISGQGFPISIEIPDTEMSKEEMVDLAQKYRDEFPKNAVIKIPMDPQEPEKAFEVIYKLAEQGIRINATIGVSMGQLVGASEALRQSRATEDNYVSLFWGRREEAKAMMINARIKNQEKGGLKLTKSEKDEISQEVPDAAATLAMTLRYLETHSLATKVIVGSIRNIHQIERAFEIGADIVTIPPKLLEEWMYTERGKETADQFNEAYRKVKDRIKLV